MLDWALAECSGDGAADAWDDGPCGMLSAVETRGAKRLLSDVWDHDPTHAEIRALLGRFHTAWSARAVLLCGVPTEGAARAPEPRREGCGDGPHHLGPLHLVAEVVQTVVGAVASVRQGWAATPPPLPQGRPSTQAAQAAACTQQRRAAPRAAWCTPRSLCVPHHRHTTARTSLGRRTRALPPWRPRRARMEPVSALLDRRCRPQTARATLATRRRLLRLPSWGATLTKLFALPLEKALPLLDAKLLPATSHAVERGNRRYRQRPKHVYRVRTPEQLRARLARDRWRAAHAEGRQQTLVSRHHARAG